MAPKALLFDLNGTIIDDMEFHTKAWQYLFNNDLGATMSWEDTKKEMYGKNQEVLVRVFGSERFTALNAGMKCIVLTTTHRQHEFDHLDNVLYFAPDYTDDYFKNLLA